MLDFGRFFLFGVCGCVLLVCSVVLFMLLYASVLYDIFFCVLCVHFVVMCFVCAFDVGSVFVLLCACVCC